MIKLYVIEPDKIYKFLKKTNISKLSRKLELSETMLRGLKNGRHELEKVTFINVITLQKYINENED